MIQIKVDTKQVTAMLGGVARQMPFAISLGLNLTGQAVKDAEIAEMKRCFDRPSPFTLSSLQLTPSKKNRLAASVWFKDPPKLGQKAHYLLPQVDGGRRPLKPWEVNMGKHYIMPGKYTQLDQYGNLGRGQITKLRSLYGKADIAGFDSTTKAKGKRSQYFLIKQTKGRLLAGIYERVQGAGAAGRIGRYMLARSLAKKNGVKLKDLNSRTKALYARGIRPVVIFTEQAPSYRQRFDFYGIAQRTIDKVLMSNMRTAVEQALKTARAHQPGLF